MIMTQGAAVRVPFWGWCGQRHGERAWQQAWGQEVRGGSVSWSMFTIIMWLICLDGTINAAQRQTRVTMTATTHPTSTTMTSLWTTPCRTGEWRHDHDSSFLTTSPWFHDAIEMILVVITMIIDITMILVRYVITGLESEHDNGPEDRRWRLQLCKIQSCWEGKEEQEKRCA